MISLDSWSIHDPQDIKIDKLRRNYDNVYIGNELSLDDRLEWIGKYTAAIGENTVSVSYDAEAATLVFSTSPPQIYNVSNLASIPVTQKRILIDATSLLLPELLYLMFWANQCGQNFDVIYVEPSDYRVVYKPKIGSNNLDFSLSDDGPGMCMLPRFVHPMDGSHLVVALGYEGHRFGGLLVSDEINPEYVTGIVGVPPFELGWEKNSFSKNFLLMDDARRAVDAKFLATAANDPLQNYNLLKMILNAQIATHRPHGQIHLAPIGTKPVALAMVWFAINNKGTGILYDFIKKKPKRTEGVGKAHFWRFSVG